MTTDAPRVIGASQRYVESAIAGADPRLLAAVLAHATGSARWLDTLSNDSRPDVGLLRTEVLDLILRNPGPVDAAACPPADDELLLRILEAVAGESVGPEYLPKLKEDLGLCPRPQWTPQVQRRPGFHVLVIGAGPAGLRAAAELERAGISFEVVEKNDDVGGVWWDNTYPGCGVDTPNQLYAYGDFDYDAWARWYPLRDEMVSYFRHYAACSKVRDSIHFGVEVRTLEFDGARKCWTATAQGPDGASRVFTADVVITATGILNRPKIPSIPGLGLFQGIYFHTAQWRSDVDLSGRVGLVGNGSSGVQVGRVLARLAQKLTAFQRKPHWAAPIPEYHTPVSEELRSLCRAVPLYALWWRFQLYWLTGDGMYKYYRIDPTWSGEGASAWNATRRQELIDYITSEVGGRADLLEKLVPDYPPYTKRMVIDNQWYRTLARDNVELVTDGIVEATPQGLRTRDGREHPLDVLIFATGFHNTHFLFPMKVRGRGGVSLEARFGSDEDVRAYLGVAVPGFPNLFHLMGPNSAIVGGSAVYTMECQANYIVGCVSAMIDRGLATLECREEVCQAYNAELDAKTAELVWSLPDAGSRYQNSSGRVVINHPWRLQDYWAMTRQPDLEDFHAAPLAPGPPLP